MINLLKFPLLSKGAERERKHPVGVFSEGASLQGRICGGGVALTIA